VLVGLIIGGLIILLVGFLIYTLFFSGSKEESLNETNFVNMEEVPFFQEFGHLNPNVITFVVGGEYNQRTAPPLFVDGRLYLPADFLREFVDPYIFWEAESARLTITTAEHVARFAPGLSSYTLNWQEQPLAFPIRQIGDMAYMAADMVTALYPASFDFWDEYNMLVVDFITDSKTIYKVSLSDNLASEDDAGANTVRPPADEGDEPEPLWLPLRFGPSERYPIMARLEAHEQVVLLKQEGDFYFVRKSNGLMGFACASSLVLDDFIPAVPRGVARRPVTKPSFDGNVNMVWHLVTSRAAAANQNNWNVLRGVNVISPTWLYFCYNSYDGTIVNMGNQSYAQWARQNGMEVWPMISDAFYRDGPQNFSNEAARLVLTDANVRDHVIAQIMDMTRRYNWDGINVDYEMVLVPEAEYFIQFLRELAVPMRQAGKVLSVAMYPPAPHNLFYNRTEIGKTVDYLVIMAYDEYWTTHERAGSVASFDFVANAVRDTLKEMPAEQIILGLPTYERIWTEEFDLESGEWRLIPFSNNFGLQRVRSVGMNVARRQMMAQGEFAWDFDLRQYYGELLFTQGGVDFRQRVWVNDLRSMREKLLICTQHNLAGVAFWQKGLELAAMWDLVAEVLD
jgi:spore germination protein YaaH